MTSLHPAGFLHSTETHGFGDIQTITDILKEEGYTCAHIGKWHIGPINEITYGIEEIKLLAGNREPGSSKDDSVFHSSIDFIKKNKDRPFYLNIWTHTCHFPLHPPANMLALFENIEVDADSFGKWFYEEKVQLLQNNDRDIGEAMGRYLAEVYSLDQNIGRLMQCLEDLDLDKNTIIIFASDQGPAPIILKKSGVRLENAKMRMSMLGYAGGLRGSKHQQYEGGVRIPFIIRWPGRIPANYVDDHSVISGLDYLPSICSMLDIEIGKDAFDGQDKSNVWYGTPETRNGPLFWQTLTKTNTISILDGHWKLHKYANNKIELYNIGRDPFEEYDVSATNKKVVQDLLDKIEQWNSSLPRYVNNDPNGLY